MITKKSLFALGGCLCMAAGLAVGVHSVSAQSPDSSIPDKQHPWDDHLKCYTVRDPLDIKGVVDLDSEQFGLEKGCKVIRARFFCVPVHKDVRWLTVNEEPAKPLPIDGDELVDDRVCYWIRCPESRPTKVAVADQFGRRVLHKRRPSLLCTPAYKLRVQPSPIDPEPRDNLR